MQPNNTYNLWTPHYVMAKPVGSSCNLHCSYCYYLLSAHNRKQSVSRMSRELLEKYIAQYIRMQPDGEVVFCWHGGEPLLEDRRFYEEALKLQRRYAGQHTILNVIQTNGSLLTDDWCRFFADNHFLVGISVDGPEALHNVYRRGAPGVNAFALAMQAIDRMLRHHVEYNILAVINDQTAHHPLEVYRFLRGLGTPFLQFSPNVERLRDGSLTPSSVRAEAFGRFYCSIFDEWWSQDVGRVYVQLFDATLACLMHVNPGVCLFGERCGHAAVLEADGSLYCCDHFATSDYLLGNLITDDLLPMMLSDEMLAFGEKKANLPNQCMQCSFLSLCHGECPKNRFVAAEEGLCAGSSEPPVNYLCKGYKQYFEHTLPYFEHMKQTILSQKS